MIIHTVKEVKDWGDPAATAEPYPSAEGGFAVLDGDSRVGGATTGTGCLRRTHVGRELYVPPRSAQGGYT